VTDQPARQPTAAAADVVTAFLAKDYELKVRYLSDHFTRMWNRFNYFLVLESALFAAFIAFFRERDDREDSAVFVAGAAVVVSACWYVFGAQDRYLVEIYRSQIAYVLGEMFRGRGQPGGDGGIGDRPPDDTGGTTAPPAPDYPQTGGTAPGPGHPVDRTPFQWRWGRLSTTTLASAFPILVLIAWAVTCAGLLVE
jgi:hypothetical protein